MSLEGYRGHSETVAFLAEGSHLTLGFECPLSGKQTLKIQFSAAATHCSHLELKYQGLFGALSGSLKHESQ